MREIPPLRVLCLRSVGPTACNPERTFAPQTEEGKISLASRLLRSFHDRPILGETDDADDKHGQSIASKRPVLIEDLPLPRLPMTKGRYPTRRPNANDVDINHPFVAALHPPRRSRTGPSSSRPITESEVLAVENGNPALDVLQSYIDALVESGRMDDSRLGKQFFEEWGIAVRRASGPASKSKKRKRENYDEAEAAASEGGHEVPRPLGTLSLQNCASISDETFRCFAVEASVGRLLGTLDLTGVHSLTDDILTEYIAKSCPNLRRLSVKNCRKITGKGLNELRRLSDLRCLDLGGSFNVTAADVLTLVESHPGTDGGTLTEIHASGLDWTNGALRSLCEMTSGHLTGLSVGFSNRLSSSETVEALDLVGGTLTRLAVPFCDNVDNGVVASLGRSLPELAVLDIRGCPVNTLTGFYDGRASLATVNALDNDELDSDEDGGGETKHLFVLARYSSITKNSLEETRRVHPHQASCEQLDCVLDGGGIGGGIRR